MTTYVPSVPLLWSMYCKLHVYAFIRQEPNQSRQLHNLWW